MVGIAEIREAQRRIAPHIRHTPMVRCAAIDRLLQAEVYLKCENLQAAGAFKTRGACNAIFSLSDQEVVHGVATHSSGNHAAALARGAARRGVPAYIVMPETSRQKKVAAVREYGGRITFCPPDLAAREATAAQIVAETGAVLIHPYDNDAIIAGQGTAAVEMLAREPQLDLIITPVGGGGLLSGTLLYVKSVRPQTQVWAGEPQGADDAYRSWTLGHWVPSVHPDTIADGLLTSLGRRNFAVISQWVDQIVRVDDGQIVRAVRWLYDEADLVVEPSGAVPLAALLARPEAVRGRKLGVILSGGNFDMSDLPPEA